MYRLVKYIDSNKLKAKKYLFEFLFYHSNLVKLKINDNLLHDVNNIQLHRKIKSGVCDVLLYEIEFEKYF